MPAKAELQSILDCDTRPFENALDKSVARSKKAGKDIGSAFEFIGPGLAAAFSVGTVLAGAKAIGAYASEIKDLSDTTNQGAESFQRFAFAVTQSSGTKELFVKSMVGIQQAMEQAKDGNTDIIDAFHDLGISMAEVRSAKPEQIFLMIADAMKKANGSGEAFRALSDLIGVKVATKMVPSLKMGADGFQELANSASVASQDTIDSIEAAQDKWDSFIQSLKTGALRAFDAFGDIGGEQTEERRKAMNDKFNSGYSGPTKLPGDAGYSAQEAAGDVGQGDMKQPRGRKWNKEEEEHADDMMKMEQDLANAYDADIQRRQAGAAELKKIYDETWYIERDIGRIGMDSQELIVDLEKERAQWLEKAVKYESDIFGIHNRDAALARQKAAQISKQIAEAPRDIVEQAFTNSPRGRKMTAEEDAAATKKDQFGAFEKFNAFSAIGGSLSSGGLTSGGLSAGGGLNGKAYSAVHRGDAAKAKAMKADEAKKAEEAKGVEGKVGEVVDRMDKYWGPKSGGKG